MFDFFWTVMGTAMCLLDQKARRLPMRLSMDVEMAGPGKNRPFGNRRKNEKMKNPDFPFFFIFLFFPGKNEKIEK